MFFERFEQNRLTINRFRADCRSCSEDIVEEIEKHCKSFYIRANRCSGGGSVEGGGVEGGGVEGGGDMEP